MVFELDLFPTFDCDIDVGGNAVAHVAAVGKLDLAVLQPCKAGTVLGVNTPKATIDALIADYDGYADLAITWGAGSRGAGGKGEIPGTTLEARPTGGAHPNMIGAFAIYNAAKTKVYAVANLPGTGIPMSDALDHFDCVIDWLPSGASKLIITT